jgi:hypothetical protein
MLVEVVKFIKVFMEHTLICVLGEWYLDVNAFYPFINAVFDLKTNQRREK